MLRGLASEKLLDSYDIERRPVAQSNADFSFGNMIRFRRIDDAVRSGNEDRIRFWVNDLDNHLHSIGQALGFTYEQGAIIPDGTPRGGHLTRVYTPTDRPGGRFPHIWLDMARKHSTLDWFDKEFTVVAGPLGDDWCEAGRDVAEKTGMPINVKKLPNAHRGRRHSHGPARRGAGAAGRPRRLAHALPPLRSLARTRRRIENGAALMETRDANGTTISFERTGHGPPLLLMHGAEADHSMFNAFVPLLADDFTVIAYDQRDSGGTRNPPAPYGFEELADDAAALIAALGYTRCPCLRHLVRRRDRASSRLASSGAHRPPGAVEHLPRRRGAALHQSGISEVRRAPRPPAGFGSASSPNIFFTKDYLAAHPDASSIFGGNTRTDEQKARRGAVIPRPISVALGKITAPTLVLVGAEDRLIPPAHTLSLAGEIRGAKTVTIPDVGHVSARQNPAAVAAAVKTFLHENGSQRQKTEENDHGRSRGGSRHAV